MDNNSDNVSKLSDRISSVTICKNEVFVKLLAPEHFNMNYTKEFVNEINLIPMQKAS